MIRPAVKMRQLRDVTAVFHGGTPSKQHAKYWNGDIPWVSPKDMKSDVLQDVTDHISQEAVESSATRIAPEMSILAVVRSGVLVHSFPVALLGKPMAFNQDIKAFVPNKDVVLPEYVHYFLRAKEREVVDRGVKKGATVHSVQSGFLESLSLPIPLITEQRRIVDILKRADGIRRMRKQAIQTARELIPALFVDMFGDPATNPKGWKVMPLGEACEINPRVNKDEKLTSETFVSFIPMAAVDEFRGEITKPQTRTFREVSKGFTAFRNRDVLFAKITPCMENGKAAIATDLVNGIGFGSTEFHVLRPNKEVLSEWLFGLIRREDFRRLAKANFSGTAGQQRAPTTFLKSLSVPIPPIEVQQEFAKQFETIRSFGIQQLNHAQSTNELFQALLHRAFRGEL